MAKEYVNCLGLLMLAAVFWVVVGENPMGFWHVAMDGPTFSLGHALNFLHYFDGRHVGNPEVVQPGVWYRLSAGQYS